MEAHTGNNWSYIIGFNVGKVLLSVLFMFWLVGQAGKRIVSSFHLVTEEVATECPRILFLSVIFQPFQSFQSTEKVQDRIGACGDGKVQSQHGEECDDGNQIVTDACLSTLTFARRSQKPSSMQ